MEVMVMGNGDHVPGFNSLDPFGGTYGLRFIVTGSSGIEVGITLSDMLSPFVVPLPLAWPIFSVMLAVATGIARNRV